ncbi:MAG: hypothetical protein ACRDI1_09330 [Actinomycetota bacterium]
MEIAAALLLPALAVVAMTWVILGLSRDTARSRPAAELVGRARARFSSPSRAEEEGPPDMPQASSRLVVAVVVFASLMALAIILSLRWLSAVLRDILS